MKQIGNYIVEDIPIGSGGMGHIFRGVAPNGVTPVAIKEILPNFVADIEYRSRIEREIEFLKKLDNDHVVQIFDHFEIGGNLYIVMEYVEGLNIEQFVEQNGAIAWQDAINYMIQLLNTMQDVHTNGIIHRDIKPGNVMIRPNGQICLLDFGVAKDSSSTPARGGTVFGTVIGTDGYMSPEQAQGMSIDHRSDIYGLGCVLYFMLTGTHAFGNMVSELKLQEAITSDEFPRLADKVKGLPPKLQKILDNAVNKNMMTRYQSCREFAAELSTMLPGGTQINTSNRNSSISVSIGRDGCDILVGTDNMRVSRHHADVTLKLFTGGEFYVYTDNSSNGTVIDGHSLSKGMSYNIPKGTYPYIVLANDPTCIVDIAEVAGKLEEKRLEAGFYDDETDGDNGSSGKGGRTGHGGGVKTHHKSTSLFGAVKTCFSKYAVFSGRASRSEYWWFVLFNILVQIAFIGISIAAANEGIALGLIAYGIVAFLPSLAVTVRRLHDTGHSWVSLFISLIPIVGCFILLAFFVEAGEPETNRFGPPTS